jgi:predicted transcriptional regulator
MTTVTIEVADIEATKRRTKAAFHGEPQGCFIRFPSHEDLWATSTANRWGIPEVMTGAGPLGVRELARCVGRVEALERSEGIRAAGLAAFERAERRPNSIHAQHALLSCERFGFLRLLQEQNLIGPTDLRDYWDGKQLRQINLFNSSRLGLGRRSWRPSPPWCVIPGNRAGGKVHR